MAHGRGQAEEVPAIFLDNSSEGETEVHDVTELETEEEAALGGSSSGGSSGRGFRDTPSVRLYPAADKRANSLSRGAPSEAKIARDIGSSVAETVAGDKRGREIDLSISLALPPKHRRNRATADPGAPAAPASAVAAAAATVAVADVVLQEGAADACVVIESDDELEILSVVNPPPPAVARAGRPLVSR